ncbi:MAG TPA: M28 family peptidase [Candidatus Limnocylindria bacterium]|nr:M28 family peptidase [Candidatus Limnocylindria bacterium]
MIRLPDEREVLATLERVASSPTAPYHEWRALDAIAAELKRLDLEPARDEYGQLSVHVSRGSAKRALAFVAHTDHPGFELVEVSGSHGLARFRGGIDPKYFGGSFPLIVYRDGTADGRRAQGLGYTHDPVLPDWSAGYCEIQLEPGAERPLALGDWAVLDMPAFERRGNELHLRSADDLSGCALILSALEALRAETRPYSVHAIFTRAEEPGLFGARLAAEDGTIPKDVFVVSVEASNSRYAPAGAGIVVRAGDFHNTFSNEAERYLRVAQEKLAERGIPTQRRLLPGGTCEASAFVRLGWTATGIALPNTGYHNAGANDDLVPEMIRLEDMLSGIALSAEAAVAAGADAEESWWPDVKVVPEEIRERLARSARIHNKDVSAS